MTSHSRPRRAFWGDVRFLIGIVLVILSVAGVWLIVASARDTTPVLQVDRTIAPGEALVSGDFRVVEVSLGTAAADYVAPHDLAGGMVASRTLNPGELLPSSAIADADSARSTTIVVESSVPIPERVDTGTVVELWQAPPLADQDGYDVPRILVADAVVASLPQEEGVLAQRSAAIELVIDRADVADVLAAITGGSSLSVVPLGAGS